MLGGAVETHVPQTNATINMTTFPDLASIHALPSARDALTCATLCNAPVGRAQVPPQAACRHTDPLSHVSLPHCPRHSYLHVLH